jgi:ketosteroid isomerase-like protein
VTRTLFVFVAVLALTPLVHACSAPPAPAAAPVPEAKPNLAADERAIREADARWLKAAQAGDAAGEGAVFASDGVEYRAHIPPIVGPAANQTFSIKFRTDNPKAKPDWSTDTIQVAEAGDMAVQTGEFRLTAFGPKGDGDDKGRFVTVWKKVNGEWKVAHDIGVSTMPEVSAKKK